MTERPEIMIQHQAAFTDDGELELTDESIETSLKNFGADVSHRDQETRLDRPATSEFNVDDRVEVHQTEVDNTDQVSLFADTAADQQTLTGEDASAQFLSMLPVRPVTDSSKRTHQPGERTIPSSDARTRVIALTAATPDPPVSGEYTHGDPCPRCEAAVLTGRFDEKGKQLLECERYLYRPTRAGSIKFS